MTNENLQLCAYHESGRVVFAYLSGFSCDQMHLSETDSGSGSSKLNAGQELQLVQAVLSGKLAGVSPENRGKAIVTAKKMMTIYCAGTCAETFYANGGELPAQLDIDIPSQDIRNIELIQKFLRAASHDHPEDYPQQVIAATFQKLNHPETWKAIEALAQTAVKASGYAINRFYIEDALLAAGITIKRQAVQSGGFSIGLQEEDLPAEKKAKEYIDESPLDILLKDFLKKIKNDWKQGEAEAAADHVKGLFRKYNA